MSLSDLISIGMTLGTGIIIFANIILMSLVTYYREEQDSLQVFCISFILFGCAWVLYISRIHDFFYVSIAVAAAFYYAAILTYYVGTSKFLNHALNYYFITAFILAYGIIYWSPGASEDMSLRSYSQALVSGLVHVYFALMYYVQFRKEKNIGHIITFFAHFIIFLIEVMRCYLLTESIEPMLILGIVVVAHTISLILNNLGIMTAFSFSHYKAVRSLSKKDSLTGLLNRRGFFELYQTKSFRYEEVAVISCDIDYFKSINDTHGHSYGDQILEKIAHELKSHTKLNFNKESLVARWGGEEFVIALFDCTINQARLLADTLRENIHNNEYEINQNNFRISLSFGVAHHQVDEDGIEHLIRQSDKALYQAKLLGRNQVACHV